jgi:hypothetical protein
MDGRPVRTRTADLYRVKGPRSRTSNNLKSVGDCRSTWKRGLAGIVTGEITGQKYALALYRARLRAAATESVRLDCRNTSKISKVSDDAPSRPFDSRNWRMLRAISGCILLKLRIERILASHRYNGPSNLWLTIVGNVANMRSSPIRSLVLVDRSCP